MSNRKFLITFRMIDHYADDVGTPTERTIIEAPCNMVASMIFCNDMEGETFIVDSVEEIK